MAQKHKRGVDKERRGKMRENNKNANDLRPGRNDKSITTDSTNNGGSEIKFFK